jgi:flagellar biosynthesis/type III secretory pathway M-ring protein FliF/YscJ
MDSVVDENQYISDARITFLGKIEAIILAVSCFVFFFVLFFIVPSLVLALRKSSSELDAIKAESESEIKQWRVSVKEYTKIKKGMLRS